MAAGGGRSDPAKFGRHPGDNRHFPAARAAADVGGGLGRDAEAEPESLLRFTICATNILSSRKKHCCDEKKNSVAHTTENKRDK
ncbi:hypothetical protein L3X38_037876 [Prunus dulcis]|uniref:Uncharacterized protein n=1 Tax=Prunus dulcis TaxID=3755 RepID=A0AAD4V4J4_PRUDU|nr:hypothetical protein L3X38_037876 [Prunus dulcis]